MKRRERRGRSRRPAVGTVVAVLAVLCVFAALSFHPDGWLPKADPSPTPPPTTAPSAAPATSTPPPATATVPPTPTHTPAPTDAPPSATPDPGAYADIPNASSGWSYFAGAPPYKDVRATLSAGRQGLVSRYRLLWQAPPATTDGPKVYLTFDEGYEYRNDTKRILDTLKDRGVPAAFFVTGTYIEQNPLMVIRMAEEGHLVCNHTWSHPSLPALVGEKGPEAMQNEIRRVEEKYRAVTGGTLARFLRPPNGHSSERTLAIARDMGYRVVFWSFAYRDWLVDDQPTPERTREAVLGQLHDGSVLLLHAVSETNTALLGELIDAIRARGYGFGSIDDIP